MTSNQPPGEHDPGESIDPFTTVPGALHGPEDGDVAVWRDRATGHAAFLPRALRDLDDHGRHAVSALQRTTIALAQLHEDLDDQVVAARACGISWAGIGWCLGVSGEAARQRFGQPPAPADR